MKATILFALPLLLIGCNQKKEELKTLEKEIVSNNPQEGKKLMETQCYVCHSPNAPEKEGRIAPPMVAIKAHYMSEGVTKEEFVGAMKSFVENPSKDKAHLKGALKRFGLMPKQVFAEGSIEKIAAYMYDYQIEEPTWFKEHWKERGFGDWTQSGKKITENDKPKSFEEIGIEYALSTQKVLGKNLMEAIQKKGTLGAVTFCNIKAMPLTDSIANQYNAVIKRVSDKNRNPNNKANAEELQYIAQFEKEIAAKKEIKAVVLDKGNKVQFYYPIQTNTKCLQCHGTQIKPDVQKQILKLYPKDLAVGYTENQVRGIWSISFDKKKL